MYGTWIPTFINYNITMHVGKYAIVPLSGCLGKDYNQHTPGRSKYRVAHEELQNMSSDAPTTSFQGNPKPSFLGGYDPYIEGQKPFIFHGFGVQRLFRVCDFQYVHVSRINITKNLRIQQKTQYFKPLQG